MDRRGLRTTLPALPLRAWLRYDAAEPFFARLPAGARVLEIGPGIGGFASRLARQFEYTGVELDPTSWATAAQRLQRLGRGRVINGDLKSLDAGERFDLVCAFEVLEHLEDPRRALAEWTRRLVPAGGLLLSVPAFQKRFGAWDVRVGHHLRYEPDELRRSLQDAGLASPEVHVYGAPLDLVVEHARNLIARLRPSEGTAESRTAGSGRLFQPPDALGWLTRAASAPFRRLQRAFFHSGIGTGIVAFARLPA